MLSAYEGGAKIRKKKRTFLVIWGGFICSIRVQPSHLPVGITLGQPRFQVVFPFPSLFVQDEGGQVE